MEKTDRILVTGAAGLLGGAIVQALRADDYTNVVGVTRADANLLDRRDTMWMIREEKPDFIFHCAARVYGILGNMNNQGRSFLENTLINTNVIDAARIAKVRKITVMGTGAVYSAEVPQPMRESDIFVGRPHPSEAGYAHAKRGMLAMLEAYQDSYGLDWAYVVSCNLFGPYDRFEPDGHVVPGLIAKFYAASKDQTPVTVWGNGSARRDFLYVADAAQAVISVMNQLSGTVNIGHGVTWEIRDIIEVLSDISWVRDIEWDNTKPNGQAYRSYDLTRLRSTGFRPQWSIREGLQETWDWYRKSIHVRNI